MSKVELSEDLRDSIVKLIMRIAKILGGLR